MSMYDTQGGVCRWGTCDAYSTQHSELRLLRQFVLEDGFRALKDAADDRTRPASMRLALKVTAMVQTLLFGCMIAIAVIALLAKAPTVYKA